MSKITSIFDMPTEIGFPSFFRWLWNDAQRPLILIQLGFFSWHYYTRPALSCSIKRYFYSWFCLHPLVCLGCHTTSLILVETCQEVWSNALSLHASSMIITPKIFFSNFNNFAKLNLLSVSPYLLITKFLQQSSNSKIKLLINIGLGQNCIRQQI